MQTDQKKIQQFKIWFKNKTVLEIEREFIFDITATKVRGFYAISPNRYVIDNSHIIQADFKMLNLNEIPESLGNLLHLKKLNLAHNNLRTLPENIQALKNLEYLDISFNRFKTLPSTLEDLPNLKSLHVVGNNFDKDVLKLLERLMDKNISIVDLLCHMNKGHYFPSSLQHHTCPSCGSLICGRCIGQLLADSRIECVWCGIKFDPRPVIENMVSSKNLKVKKYGECLKLMYAKNYDAAVKAFLENQRDNESDASYWFNVGFSLNALERYAEANECWERANKLRPRHIDTITHWRVALKYLGQTEELIRVDLDEDLDSKELDFLEELEIIKKYKNHQETMS